jgi:hypothetical protein
MVPSSAWQPPRMRYSASSVNTARWQQARFQPLFSGLRELQKSPMAFHAFQDGLRNPLGGLSQDRFERTSFGASPQTATTSTPPAAASPAFDRQGFINSLLQVNSNN